MRGGRGEERGKKGEEEEEGNKKWNGEDKEKGEDDSHSSRLFCNGVPVRTTRNLVFTWFTTIDSEDLELRIT